MSLLVLTSACKPEDKTSNSAQFAAGVYVVNEGPFSSGSGSISHRSAESGEVISDVYFAANAQPAGAVLNSMVFSSTGEAWIVSNLSGSLEAVSANSFKSLGKVFGLGSPRYVLELEPGLAALSDWSANVVYLVDMQNYELIDTLEVGRGPEQMVSVDGKLYVANSGGFGRDSTVSIIDLQTKQRVDRKVGDQPISMLVLDGAVWVLCAGYADYIDPSNDTPGRLVKLDPADGSELDALEFGVSFGHPGRLCADASNSVLYFLDNGYGGSLYRTDTQLSLPELIRGGSYYSTGFDPIRKEILLANPLSYNVNGYAVRLKTDGSPIDSFQVGLIPSNFAFR